MISSAVWCSSKLAQKSTTPCRALKHATMDSSSDPIVLPKNNCRYFNFGKGLCLKGLVCKFPHVDMQGVDWKVKMAQSGEAVEGAPLGAVSPTLDASGQPQNLLPLGVVPEPSALPKDVRKIYEDWHLQKAAEFAAASDDEEEVVSGDEGMDEMKDFLETNADACDLTGDDDVVEAQTLSIDETRLAFEKTLDEIRDACPSKPLPFYRHPISIKINEEEKKRLPYESFFHGDYIEVKVGEKKHIVWECMLYGGGKKVEPHVASCIRLGYQLRTELEPVLLKEGYTFANVLIITKEAFSEAVLRRVANFWSVKVVELPEVHSTKLRGVSQHLKNPECDERHVFLKNYAWKMDASISVISDLDVLVINPQVLANFLIAFIEKEDYQNWLQCYGTAVMNRVWSEVTEKGEPSLRAYEEWEKPDKVSYCMAVVKPSAFESERYDELLKSDKGTTGLLSDQDFLCNYLKEVGGYILLPHSVMLFPSWLNHDNIMQKRLEEVVTWMNSLKAQDGSLNYKKDKKSIECLSQDFMVHRWFHQFGAIHTSSAFDVGKIQTKKQFVEDLCHGKACGKGKIRLHGNQITHPDVAGGFMYQLKILIQRLHEKTITKIAKEMEIVMGSDIDAIPKKEYSLVYTFLIRHLSARIMIIDDVSEKKGKSKASSGAASSGSKPSASTKQKAMPMRPPWVRAKKRKMGD